jgi:hypothetical protein
MIKENEVLAKEIYSFFHSLNHSSFDIYIFILIALNIYSNNDVVNKSNHFSVKTKNHN